MENNTKVVLSIILPLYNESTHIYNTINIINDYINSLNLNYEILVIDDGSRDDTYDILKKILLEIKEIKIIKLSRNFGKEYAICAGLDLCQGDACIVMDADLQHPPSLISEMVQYWRSGYDIVECIKVSRGKEKIHIKLGSKIFYGLLKRLSGFDLDGASDFKLLDKKVINSWRSLNERNTFFRGLSVWLGYNRIQIPFEVAERAGGNTHWSILSLAKLAISALTSFSSVPLQLITIMGNVFLIIATVLSIEVLSFKILGKSVSGFTTVILLLLFIGSILMISLGIIGSYVAKIYEEIKYRPRYIIERIVEENSIDNKPLDDTQISTNIF